MAKVCVNCGKKVGAFSMMPLKLPLNQELCYECAEPIQSDIIKLYDSKTMEDFKVIKEEIAKRSKECFDESVCAYINELIDTILVDSKHIDTSAKNLKNGPDKMERFNNYMVTTGYDFAGYTIKEYLGIDGGQVVLGTGFLSEFSASFSDFLGVQSETFEFKLQQAKDAAMQKLITKSHLKGANALIGISFDYITFHGNMIGVVANGTSVIIEKNI